MHPRAYGISQFSEVANRVSTVSVIKVEEVAEPGEICLGKRIDIFVRPVRSHSHDPHVGSIEVERAKAVEPDDAQSLWGWQVCKHRHQLGLTCVVSRILTGKTSEQVP